MKVVEIILKLIDYGDAASRMSFIAIIPNFDDVVLKSVCWDFLSKLDKDYPAFIIKEITVMADEDELCASGNHLVQFVGYNIEEYDEDDDD